MKRAFFLSGIFVLAVTSLAWADGFIVTQPIPPDRVIPPNLAVKYHRVDVQIDDQVARTSVDQVFVNNYPRDIEGTYIFPMPAQAAISDFAMFVGNEPIRGQILGKDEARRIYEEIVRRRKDPALLEYAGNGMFQASVYPIPARGETRIQLHYSEVLAADAGVREYRYTLGTEKFSRDPLETIEMRVRIESKAPITTIYSPSHDIRVERHGDHEAIVTYADEHTRPDKDFLLYYGVSQDEIGANLITFEDEHGDGYFLTLITPRVGIDTRIASSKDVVFILDTSGSMQGEKIAQAKSALAFCLNGLGEGDRFNVIDFDDNITPFQRSLVPADSRNVGDALRFVDRCAADGGTNINDALREGLGEIARGERPSFIIFLTDGLPTVGETDVSRILANVEYANRSETRLFVFGVGYDVNTRLLDRLAGDNHGTSDYVHPSEDIEVKVSSFFKKVSHPILTDVDLTFEGVKTFDRYPKELPDVFSSSEILVLGRYDGNGRARMTLTGRSRGETRRLSFNVSFAGGTRNDFVPRLWATRKIGYLIDQLRTHADDRELVSEVVRLSKQYGIITEYTSFLVDADYRVAVQDLVAPVEKRLRESTATPSGAAAVNRSQAQKKTMAMPRPTSIGEYTDAEGVTHETTRIVQAGAKTFYEKNGQWVQSDFGGQKETVKVKRFSNAYFELLKRAPDVGKYYALGDSVIFTIHGTAVEVSDEGKSELTSTELHALVGP
jgi:Ca-activated chloride channel family protein